MVVARAACLSASNVTKRQDQRHVLLCVLVVCAGRHLRRRQCVGVATHLRELQLERARQLSPALSTCLVTFRWSPTQSPLLLSLRRRLPQRMPSPPAPPYARYRE